jgi:hypothetical protein
MMDVDIINGNKINSSSKLQFPYQKRPTQANFVVWKDSVHKSLCIYRLDPSNHRTIVRSHFPPSGTSHTGSISQSDYTDIIRAISGYTTLAQKFNNLPFKFKDIIGDLHLPEDEGQSLIQALKDRTVALASDGSYMENLHKGTHAYLLVLQDSDLGLIQGSATSPHSDRMSSVPTEHYGAIAVSTVLVVLLYHHNKDLKMVLDGPLWIYL